jgi:hypothetical protein
MTTRNTWDSRIRRRKALEETDPLRGRNRHVISQFFSYVKSMTEETGRVRTFDIEGQEVRCHELDGHRFWRSECAAFQKRLEKFGEGFCAHLAIAIDRSITDGSLKL